MSGCCLISSRPALRPSCVNAKSFSQDFNSARRFTALDATSVLEVRTWSAIATDDVAKCIGRVEEATDRCETRKPINAVASRSRPAILQTRLQVHSTLILVSRTMPCKSLIWESTIKFTASMSDINVSVARGTQSLPIPYLPRDGFQTTRNNRCKCRRAFTTLLVYRKPSTLLWTLILRTIVGNIPDENGRHSNEVGEWTLVSKLQ